MAEVRLPKRIMNSGGWCQGCGHGVVVRLIAEVLDELGVADKAIAVEDVACGSMSMSGVLNCDAIMAAHGRPIPVANGAKGARPDSIVYAHLGDGSAYSIGSAELVHTALRGDNMTVIVVNNTVYGMTGGQMAPTTLPAEKTASSPKGKDADRYGVLNVVDLIGKLNATYIARGEIYDVASTAKTKAMIKKAFQNQIDNKGFSLVEVLAPCPTNLHMTPVQCKEFVHTEATKFFPLGEFVDK
ncbi:MAG: 2-oxoglutarate oxidoreductase [Eubacteriales Family XIII. Incertae Sedis bacterium]|nr:MAG: 2-oxoglutarate oxidoreductase [Clostridiales Family XIII bacterium]